MTEQRLDELRLWARALPPGPVADHLTELIEAVQVYRDANASTNDLRVSERKRFTKMIQDLRSEVSDLEQDEDPARVFRAEQEAAQLRAEVVRLKQENEDLRNDLSTIAEEHMGDDI